MTDEAEHPQPEVHPNTAAYCAGYEARRARKLVTDSPYTEDGPDADEWARGNAQAGIDADSPQTDEAAFAGGQHAFHAGKTQVDNPHPFDTLAHSEWAQGWAVSGSAGDHVDEPKEQGPAADPHLGDALDAGQVVPISDPAIGPQPSAVVDEPKAVALDTDPEPVASDEHADAPQSGLGFMNFHHDFSDAHPSFHPTRAHAVAAATAPGSSLPKFIAVPVRWVIAKLDHLHQVEENTFR